jgi:hypothetical protein
MTPSLDRRCREWRLRPRADDDERLDHSDHEVYQDEEANQAEWREEVH